MKNKLGFTLLELLVVVLIIGILAGIALPQYRKVKEKAEASQLLTLVKTFHEAQQRFYLINNTFATNFDDLDIEFSGFKRSGCGSFSSFPKSDCMSDGKNVIFISTIYGIASYALRGTGKYKYGGFMFQEEDNDIIPKNKLLCYRNNSICSLVLNCEVVGRKTSADYYYSCQF